MTHEELERKRIEFEAKGYRQLGEFEHRGQRFVVYRMQPNHPMNFITGDMFDWAFGLRYDEDIRQIVQDYLVEEDVKMKIENVLHAPRV